MDDDSFAGPLAYLIGILALLGLAVRIIVALVAAVLAAGAILAILVVSFHAARWLLRRLGAFWSAVLALVVLVLLGTGLAVASIADSVKAWLGVASLDPVAYLVLYCLVLAAVITVAWLVFAGSLAIVRLARGIGSWLAFKIAQRQLKKASRHAEAEMSAAAERIARNYGQRGQEILSELEEYDQKLASRAAM